jgi:hypothetical protein
MTKHLLGLLLLGLVVASTTSTRALAYEEPGYASPYWSDEPLEWTRHSTTELYTPMNPNYPYDQRTYGKYSGLHWSPQEGWHTGRGIGEGGGPVSVPAVQNPETTKRGFYEYYGR